MGILTNSEDPDKIQTILFAFAPSQKPCSDWNSRSYITKSLHFICEIDFVHVYISVQAKNPTVVTPGRVAQSVTCLATDASLTADPGVASSILARSHTFVEIDHEMVSMVILLPSAESFKKGCCQLQAKVCARSTG